MSTQRIALALACGLALAACEHDPLPPADPPAAPRSVSWPVVTRTAAVNAVAIGEDGTVYLGGAFTRLGPMTGGGVPLVGEAGQPASAFPRVDGWVSAAVPDGAGGWYVGGEFQRVGGEPRRNLAHVLADGTLDPFFAPAATHVQYGGWITALALDAGVLYVGGVFDTLDGAPRADLGAVDLSGRVTGWAPVVASGDATVIVIGALAIRAGEVIVGGRFATVDGQPRTWLAAVRPDGSLSPWSPSVASGYLGHVEHLAVAGDLVYAAGSFEAVGGQPRRGLVALDATGAPTSWNPALNGYGWLGGLAMEGGKLYVGGDFTTVDGQPRAGLAAFDAAGALLPWAPALESPRVTALAAAGGLVYVGYVDTSFPVDYGLAAFDAAGARTAWEPDPGEEGGVAVLAPSGGQVYAGGGFRWIGKATRRNGLAAVGPDGQVTSWNPGLDLTPLPSRLVPAVHALAVAGGTVHVGGAFDRVGGQARQNLAAVDTSGAVTSWNPGASGPVFALAVRGDLLHVGGSFLQVGGLQRWNLAAIRPSGEVTAWDPRPNHLVTCLAVDGATLYAGGYFTAVTLLARQGLAAFGADGGLLPWSPTFAGAAGLAQTPATTAPATGVWAIAPAGGTVYVSGDFASAGGSPRQRLAALDTATGDPTPFAPALDGGWPAFSLALHGPALLVGGYFNAWYDRAAGVELQPALYAVPVPATSRAPTPLLPSYTGTSLDPNSPYAEHPHVGAIAVRGGVAHAAGRFWGDRGGPARRWNVAAVDEAGLVAGWDPNPAP